MKISILVVEDEHAIQELIAINLSLSGYKVIRANDAEIALSILRETLPDMLLVDWMLPGQSGIQLIRVLRSHPHTKALPIMMLTVRSERQDKLLALESGADDYMTKPFSPREMIARVQAVLFKTAAKSATDTFPDSRAQQ
ncbi:response regulator [Undibacterium sp. Ren11W]|uniref:response regulator n=1 Tax=Undibacterium sp. Ren11W TaxID=3413045 RepID=UPI003BF1AD74